MKSGIFEIINNLKNKKFSKKMMGYDPIQVDGFLKKISHQLKNTFADHQEMKRKLKQFEVELIEFKEREDLLKSTLSNATKMSDQIKKDSTRESRLIISDAEHRAEIITREAKDSLKKIYQDISELRRVRLQFENNLKAILSSHMTMMEQSQRTIPDPIIDQNKLRMDLKSLNPKVINAENLEGPKADTLADFPTPQLEI